MTSLDTEHDFIPGEEPKPAVPTIGPPPFDAPLVKATVNAVAACGNMERLILTLQDKPRDRAAVVELLGQVDTQVRAFATFYAHFIALLDCEGQA